MMASEKRLIDANDVYPLFDKDEFATLHVTDIDTMPRVDAVEVVRCKDCVSHGNCDSERVFTFYCGISDPFCCAGRRKTNG